MSDKIFLLGPVVAMLFNEKLKRWHPIVFEEKPLPGNPENLVRHKSKMHHTAGFATREEALESIGPEITSHIEGECRLMLEGDMLWDGEGIPSMVEFFLPQER
jgi:hypothetical protein